MAYEAFTHKAGIITSDASKLPAVSKKLSYNDDIKLEHFQSSARHYAGHQRRGVIDEHMECLSMLEHVDAALFSPFFLSLSVPLPASISNAATFIRDSPPGLILNLWIHSLRPLIGLYLILPRPKKLGLL